MMNVLFCRIDDDVYVLNVIPKCLSRQATGAAFTPILLEAGARVGKSGLRDRVLSDVCMPGKPCKMIL